MTSESSAAAQLEGETLSGGWTVLKKLDVPPKTTGGSFSVGYLIRHENNGTAFLKALDFSGAFGEENPMIALQGMAASYNFERDILLKCKGMSRVVMAIDSGTFRLNKVIPYPDVPYLIFELADCDVRRFIDFNEKFDTAWALRSLHHVAVALSQLHDQGIAHQDLKPSNVLVFGGRLSKVCDFGKAALRGQPSPHEHDAIPGDRAYAPPELLYNSIHPDDWNLKHLGCDVYLLGSLLLFFFARVSMTSALLSKLPEAHRPLRWTGTFPEVIPYIREAFGQIIIEFKEHVPGSLRMELTEILQHLCEPDPKLRGHPMNRIGHTSQYSLERYVSIFDRLAKRCEYGLIST